MAYYNKKIVYLSYMEYGNRVRSAGYIKIEVKNSICTFCIHISGMEKLPDKKYEIYIVTDTGKESLLDRLYFCKGICRWEKEFERENITEAGVSCERIEKFLIKIEDGKVIEGRNTLKERESFEKSDEKKLNQKRSAEKKSTEKKSTEKKLNEEKPEAPAEEAESKEEHGKSRDTETAHEETEKEKNRIIELKAGSMEMTENCEIKLDAIILNDKWQQLCQLYPVIHPYEDDREYISIQPKDFVIMTGDYQHMANNSFLLHGFYNYRHIILGKEKENFYLGVPGVYYEREKMVALMFGFEAFECSGGNAEAGKFGYYLRKVKI